MDRGTSVDSACDGAGGEIAGDRAAGPSWPAVLACAEDYERALARIDELWNFSFGTPEYAETERLCDLVHAYEEEQWASMGDGALRQAYEDAKSPSRAAGLLVEARLALEAVHRDLRQAHRDLEHHISMRQAAHDVLDLAMAWGREAVAEVGDRQDHGGSVDGRRLAMAIERAREHASQRDHATRLMMEARRERDEALREVGEVTRLLRLWHADELARRQERDEARAEAVRLREELHRNSTWTGLVCQDLQRERGSSAAAAVAGLVMARAEVAVLRGVGCREVRDIANGEVGEVGPCGVCLRCAEERGALWALCYMDAHDPPEGDDATIAAEVCRQAREGGGVATRRRKAVRDGER